MTLFPNKFLVWGSKKTWIWSGNIIKPNKVVFGSFFKDDLCEFFFFLIDHFRHSFIRVSFVLSNLKCELYDINTIYLVEH